MSIAYGDIFTNTYTIAGYLADTSGFTLVRNLPVRHTTDVFHIGDVVRRVRKQRKLTIVQLSDAAKISKTTLSEFERGKNFKRETLEKIARGLGTTEADIYALHAEFQKGVRRELLKQMGTNAPDGVKSAVREADTSEAPGHETVTDPAGGVMGIDLSNPAYREALAAFERLTPEQQEQAIDYMRDLRRGVHHRQPGKRRA